MKRFLLSLSPIPENNPKLPKLLHPLSAVRLNLPKNTLRRSSCPPLDVSGGRRPLGIGCSFRVFVPGNYRGVGFREPALPLAVSSAVRVSFAGPRRSGLADQCILSSSFAFLQSLPQPDLADRPQPVSSSHGLSFPSAHEGLEVHLARGPPRRPLRSARRVW
jgi:hypothetical protein